MRVRRLVIKHYRGVSKGQVDFRDHSLLVGGNNTGKSTVCEAIELVLGPERLGRRPIVDEHDFFQGQYLDTAGKPIEIRIEVLLTELTGDAEIRFRRHLRRWDEAGGTFADEGTQGPEAGDEVGTCWALPLIFIGRYDAEEDDFIGNTFFDHPRQTLDDTEEDERLRLGEGRQVFSREHKRLCGFLFLRALRTGSRALSLQRGSLLDTILRLPGTGLAEMWQDTLRRLRELDPAIGEITQLKQISAEIRARMAQFVNLAGGDDSTAFFASDLTREHLREVVKLFVSVEPGNYLLPFQRLGTGSVNLLVFALLTFIAELKKKQTVIFAMEEPEIALPPHTQRRVTRFVLSEMGQAIVTSHSPYVIEQFDPQQIVVLSRNNAGELLGTPVDLYGIKPKVFSRQRRQFAEAILARAVLVVEGATEAAILPVASAIMEQHLGIGTYSNFDISGVTVFDAGGDGSTAQYGPFFKTLGKLAFCFYDKPNGTMSAAATADLASYTKAWESPAKGIEALLVDELSEVRLRGFLESVKQRADYPAQHGAITAAMSEPEVRDLARRVLESRKGDNQGYGPILISQCADSSELPATLKIVLTEIHAALAAIAKEPTENPAAEPPQAPPTGQPMKQDP